MKDVKSLIKRIAAPSKPASAIMGMGFILMVFYVLSLGISGTFLAYAAYLLSAYGLYLLIRSFVIPAYRYGKKLAGNVPMISLYMTDRDFHAQADLYIGTISNSLYVIFKLVSGAYIRSELFIMVGIYYLALLLLRLSLIRDERRGPERSMKDSWSAYRRTGLWLIFINLAMLGALIQIFVEYARMIYPGQLIFVMALYAFYRIIRAVISYIKDKRRLMPDPIYSASKTIYLIIAVIAMLMLEEAMLARFASPGFNVRGFSMITGLVVMITVLALSVRMAVKGNLELKKLRDLESLPEN